jgi:hypothetical protein
MAYVLCSVDATDTEARSLDTEEFLEEKEAIAFVNHVKQANTDSSADFPESDQAGKLVEDMVCVMHWPKTQFYHSCFFTSTCTFPLLHWQRVPFLIGGALVA